MWLKKHLKQVLEKVIFFGERLPNRVFLSQVESQREVSVWLLGAGAPTDVTLRHCQASGSPFTICVEFPSEQAPTEAQIPLLKLQFRVSGGGRQVLGQVDLAIQDAFECDQSIFFLFHARASANYCLSQSRIWAHTLWQVYFEWRKRAVVRTSVAQWRAMAAMFCCPRPVSLLSVSDDEGNGNIYPLNVMGNLGPTFFGFCLKHGYLPEAFVQRTKHLVLSSVPMIQGPIAYSLGPNHNRSSISWASLPFSTRPSKLLQIPVPQFARRVRELHVEQVHRLGFHTFFLARVLSDEQLASSPELYVAHGFYKDWRVGNLEIDKQSADAENIYVQTKLTNEQASRISLL